MYSVSVHKLHTNRLNPIGIVAFLSVCLEVITNFRFKSPNSQSLFFYVQYFSTYEAREKNQQNNCKRNRSLSEIIRQSNIIEGCLSFFVFTLFHIVRDTYNYTLFLFVFVSLVFRFFFTVVSVQFLISLVFLVCVDHTNIFSKCFKCFFFSSLLLLSSLYIFFTNSHKSRKYTHRNTH